MKNNKLCWWQSTGFLMLGIICCYITLQYQYFNVNTELNVVELLLNFLTIGIGFYIAKIIQNQHNKKQNIYNFIQNKLDILWQDFIKLEQKLSNKNSILHDELIPNISNLYKGIENLKRVFNSLKVKDTKKLTEDLTNNIDILENSLTNNNKYPLKNNYYNYATCKKEIENHLYDINIIFCELFAKIL